MFWKLLGRLTQCFSMSLHQGNIFPPLDSMFLKSFWPVQGLIDKPEVEEPYHLVLVSLLTKTKSRGMDAVCFHWSAFRKGNELTQNHILNIDSLAFCKIFTAVFSNLLLGSLSKSILITMFSQFLWNVTFNNDDNHSSITRQTYLDVQDGNIYGSVSLTGCEHWIGLYMQGAKILQRKSCALKSILEIHM